MKNFENLNGLLDNVDKKKSAESSKVIIEEYYGAKLDDKEIKKRKKITREIVKAKEKREKNKKKIDDIRARKLNGELLSSIEFGMLSDEDRSDKNSYEPLDNEPNLKESVELSIGGEKQTKEKKSGIIIEESYGSKLSDEEIKERRKIIEEIEVLKDNRDKDIRKIFEIKEKVRNGELINSIEAGLLRAENKLNEPIENTEENMIEAEIQNDPSYVKFWNEMITNPSSVAEEVKKELEEDILTSSNIKIEKSSDTPEQKNEITNTAVLEEALKNFNLRKEDLEEIKNFSNLSEGQQKLALNNLRQLSLGRIQSEAFDAYKNKLNESGFLGRLWRGVSKKYQIASLEKEKASEIEKGGIDTHGEVLKQLAKGLKDLGPSVEIKENGELEIKYISEQEFENLNDAQKNVFNNFNLIANKFCKLPEEYRFDTANKKDNRRYMELEREYNEAREYALFTMRDIKGEENSFLQMNKIDLNIRMNQFFTNNTDVEKQLEYIKDDKVWSKIITSVATERGIYVGAGYLTRSVLVGMLGTIGVPLAAAGMGGWIANRRAKESLTKKEVMGRKGVEDESATVKNFVKADTLITNIDRLIRRIDQEGSSDDSIEIDELRKSLALRVKYTNDKLDDGLVDFGAIGAQISKTEDERKESEKRGVLGNRYLLIRKLSEALAVSGHSTQGQEKTEERLFRLVKFLNFQEERISKVQRNYLIKETLKGAGIAGGFAFGGYMIRHFAGEWFGWGDKGITKESVQKVVIGKDEPSMRQDILEKAVKNLMKEPAKIVSESVDRTSELLRKTIENVPMGKNGDYVIKDFMEKGFKLIVKLGNDGKAKFGIDGPTALGRYNWGAGGKGWLFKADADFNSENLEKAKEFIKKAADSFYKGPSYGGMEGI